MQTIKSHEFKKEFFRIKKNRESIPINTLSIVLWVYLLSDGNEKTPKSSKAFALAEGVCSNSVSFRNGGWLGDPVVETDRSSGALCLTLGEN